VRILWLKSEILHPVDKGGKIRSYQMLRQLKRDHQITYVSFLWPGDTDDSIGRSVEYADRLITVKADAPERYTLAFYAALTANMAGRLPYSIQKYRSQLMNAAIATALESEKHDVLVCDFLTPAINLPDRIPIPSIIFQHNVESMIWQRHYLSAGNIIKKAFFYEQHRRMERYESETLKRFDAVVAVSESDRNTMRTRFGTERIYSVPTGVDTVYFAPDDLVEPDPYELVFTGSMDYLPNEDAIVYFAESILPLVVERLPHVKLTVVGRDPGARLRLLAKSNPRILVTGVVDDVRPYIAQASCFVVPIRIGGGTRLKIFEAMSMEKPVVSTSVGAEGLPVSDGVDCFLADDARTFADKVIAVITDPAAAARISRQARLLVATRFSWESAAQEFGRICQEVGSKKTRSRAA
jgi:polysaccharide biosynthesis protein PslH